MAVPPDPGPHLVVVRPHFALGLLEQALDGPPRARHPHQIGQARPLGRVGQVERHLVRPGDAAPDQERAREALGRAVERQVRPVIQARTLGAVPCAEALPSVRSQVLDPRRHRAPPEPPGVAQEHAHLRVLDPARRARILSLHPGRLGALLQEPGLVQHRHQHRRWVGQVFHHIALQVVPGRVRVPAHPRQELLHSVRRRVACGLGQLPAVVLTYASATMGLPPYHSGAHLHDPADRCTDILR